MSLGIIASVGGASAMYNKIMEGKRKTKAATDKANAEAALETFTIGNINYPVDPRKEMDSDKRASTTVGIFEQFLNHKNSPLFIAAYTNPESNMFNTAAGEEFRQKYMFLQQESLKYYIEPQRGADGGIIGLRTFDENKFSNDPEFIASVHRARGSEPGSHIADIDKTAEKLGLSTTESVAKGPIADNEEAQITPPLFMGPGISSSPDSSPDNVARIQTRVDAENESVDGELPAKEKENFITLNEFLYMDTGLGDTWSRYSRVGLTTDENRAWGELTLRMGVQGDLNRVIKAVSVHIPNYKPPVRQSIFDSMSDPVEKTPTYTENKYWETKWSMTEKVFEISSEIYKVIMDPEDGIFAAGAAGNWQNVIENYTGVGGVFDSIGQVADNLLANDWKLGTYTQTGKTAKFSGKDRKSELKFLSDLGIKGNLSVREHLMEAKKGGPARLESLLVAYAFAIAIANQDYQGGKAVSDADFRLAYMQVTGGLSQGSLFHGWKSPTVLLTAVQTVRDSLASAGISSYIYAHADVGKKRTVTKFMMDGIRLAGGEGGLQQRNSMIYKSIFSHDPFENFRHDTRNYFRALAEGGNYGSIKNSRTKTAGSLDSARRWYLPEAMEKGPDVTAPEVDEMKDDLIRRWRGTS